MWIFACGGGVWGAIEAANKATLPRATRDMIARDGEPTKRAWAAVYDDPAPVAKPAIHGLLTEYRHPRD